MVKKYSKKTYKRKNKISRKRKSKRNHSRYKKKKTKKKKQVKNMEDNLKAGMQSSPESREEGELSPESLSGEFWNLISEQSIAIPERKDQVPQRGVFASIYSPNANLHKDEKEIIDFINHSNIRGKIITCCIIANHGAILSFKRPPPSKTGARETGVQREKIIPPNFALLFTTLISEVSWTTGWNANAELSLSDDVAIRPISEIYGEYNITKAILNAFTSHGGTSVSIPVPGTEPEPELETEETNSEHIKRNIYGDDGCLTENGEKLKNKLLDVMFGGENKKEYLNRHKNPVSIYRIMTKLQLYTEGEQYNDQIFECRADKDKNKLGVTFNFIDEDDGRQKVCYYNFKKTGFNYDGKAYITLEEIFTHVNGILKGTSEKADLFIFTHRSCRSFYSEKKLGTALTRQISREHGSSDSIDCYIKKFHPSIGQRIKQTIEDLAKKIGVEFRNMNDFYGYLKNEGKLDEFVELEEGKIVKFFRVLATEKRIPDRWLDLANKERLNHPPGDPRRLRFPLLAATLLSPSPSTQPEDAFFVGEPPEPEPEK